MTPGLSILASLHRAPLDPADLHALGLAGEGVIVAERFALRATDLPGAESSFSLVRRNGLVFAFAGYLSEQEALASTLGLSTDASPATLALAAFKRFGPEAPLHLDGQWAAVQWEPASSTLTVQTSETCRDPLFFTSRDGRLAIAPRPLLLGKLSWFGGGVGGAPGLELDDESFTLAISQARLRRALGERTIWRGISQVLHPATTIFTEAGHRSVVPSPLPPPVPWEGDFYEAVQALDTLGRKIVRQALVRYGRSALMMSGGLDSSLMASWAAAGQGPGREIFSVTSVAPPGSGLNDEREAAASIGQQLGFPVNFVCPDASASAFFPEWETFDFYQKPVLDPRHYLDAALRRAAAQQGARAMLTGSGGELSVTDPTSLPASASWPRRLARSVKQVLRKREPANAWPLAAFPVRLSRERYNALPSSWQQIWLEDAFQPKPASGRNPAGIHPSVYKHTASPALDRFHLRLPDTFYDRRLVRLAARMPQDYSHHGGIRRALAREMLRGRLSEQSRLQTTKLPFSPDWRAKVIAEANMAVGRLGTYQAAGVEEWLDLPWLRALLERISMQRAPSTFQELFDAQINILVAEFLMWQK